MALADEARTAHPAQRRGPEGLRAVDRATRILFTLAAHPTGISLADLARETDLTLTTVHRMISALRGERLTRETTDGLQALGSGSLILARGFLGGLDFRVEALPVLSELREQTNEACHLGTLANPHVVYVDKLESTHAVRVASRIGGTVPAVTTALGRAILAYSQEPIIDEVLAASARQLGLTIDAKDFSDLLAEARDQGFSTDHGENQAGVHCVGAPIFDDTGAVIAGVSISVPAVRYQPDRAAEVGAQVRAATKKISAALGAGIGGGR